MNPALRFILLLGCLGLSLLDAPRAGALLAEAAVGPYSEPAADVAEPGGNDAMRFDAALAPTSLGLLVIPVGAWSTRAPGEEPWCLGLPRGM